MYTSFPASIHPDDVRPGKNTGDRIAKNDFVTISPPPDQDPKRRYILAFLFVCLFIFRRKKVPECTHESTLENTAVRKNDLI